MDGAVSVRTTRYYLIDELRQLEAKGISREEMKAWGWFCPKCKNGLTLAFGDQRAYFRNANQSPHECEAPSIVEGTITKDRFNPRALAKALVFDLGALAPRKAAPPGTPSDTAGDQAHSDSDRTDTKRSRIKYTLDGRPETLGHFASLLVQLDRDGIDFRDRQVKGLYGNGKVLLSDVIVTPSMKLEHILKMPRIVQREEVFVYGVVVDARPTKMGLSVQLKPAGHRQALSAISVTIPLEFEDRIRPSRSVLVRALSTSENDKVWFYTKHAWNVALGKLESLDGEHYVYSEDELLIDDYFTCKSISHTVPSQHEDLWNLQACRERFFGWIPDWILHLPSGQQVIVEYFGFAQEGEFGKRYAAKREEKLSKYPQLAPEFAFIALEQAKARNANARKTELYAALDRALEPLIKPK